MCACICGSEGPKLVDFTSRLPLLLTPFELLAVPDGATLDVALWTFLKARCDVAIKDDVISDRMSNLTDGQIEVGRLVAEDS
eukprot:6483239-Amphidinium_carterae.2